MLLTFRLPLLILCLMWLAGPAQVEKSRLFWAGVSADFLYKKQGSFYEVENAQRSPWEKDYFTFLFNHEWRFKKVKPGIGASYWILFDDESLAIPELRPHVQAEWSQEKGRFSWLQRSRFENRLLRDTLQGELLNSFSYHLRPRLLFEFGYYVISKERKHALQLLVFNEIIANQNRLNYLNFTENRIFGGFILKLRKHTAVRMGYLWLYSKDRRIRSTDVFYITIKNNFVMSQL